MPIKTSSNTLVHDLPPLPSFEDDDEPKSVAHVKKPSTPAKKSNQTLDTLSARLEDELHKSDLFRKEEQKSLRSEKKFDTQESKLLKSVEDKAKSNFKAPPNKDTLSDASLKKVIDDEVSHHLKKDSVDKVKTEQITQIDAMQKRQQNYFDTLRARLDYETRERQEHVKQKHAQVEMKEGELLKWEKALLEKEKRVANNDAEYTRIKELEHKLNDTTITVSYEKARVKELEKNLLSKEQRLLDLERALALKEEQLHLLAEELVERSAVIEKHTSSELDNFASEHKKLHSKFEESLKSGTVKDIASKPIKSTLPAQHFSKTISPKRSDLLEKLRVQILDCYSAIGANDIRNAAQIYTQAKADYLVFKSEFGGDSQLHGDLLSLHADISSQMRQ